MKDLIISLVFKGDTGPLDKVNKQVDELGEKAEKSGMSLGKLGEKAGKIGKAMTVGLTAPIVGFGIASVKSIADFDDGMANVQKLSGATKGEMESLRNEAKLLGRTTAFSASEASEGMGILASSGMVAGDTLKVTGDMLNLMSAGTVDADTSARVLTKSMAQFNLTADDSQRIVDTFASTSANSSISVGELEHHMGIAGGTMSSMNMSIEESTASLGHLVNAGMNTGQVGTTVNAMSREIKANAGEFEALGVQVYDTEGKLKTLPAVMGELEDSLRGKSDAERDSALATVFSGQAMQGASAWIKEGSASYGELADSIKKSKNQAQIMADIQEDTLAGAFRAVGSAISGVMVEIGEVLKGPLQSMAEKLVDIANKFSDLPDGMKTIAVVVGGIVASIGPLLVVFSKVVEYGPKIGGAMKLAFGALTSPTGIAIVAIVAVGVALAVLWNKSETFRTIVTNAFEAVKSKVQELIPSIQDGLGQAFEFIKGVGESAISGLASFWESHGSSIMNIVSAIGTVLTVVLGGAFAFVKASVTTFASVFVNTWDIIKGAVTSAVSIITGIMSVLINVISGAIDIIKGVFTGDFAMIGEGFMQVFTGIKDLVVQVIPEILNLIVHGLAGIIVAIGTVLGGAMTFIGEVFMTIFNFVGETVATMALAVIDKVLEFGILLVESFMNIVESVTESIVAFKDLFVESFMNIFESVIESVSAFAESFVSSITGLVTNVVSKVSEMASQFTSKISEMVSSTVSKGAEIVSSFVSAITSLASQVISTITSMVSGFIAQLSSMVSQAGAKARATGQAILSAFRALPGQMLTIGKNIIQGLLNGISSMAGAVVDKAKSIANSVKDSIAGALRIKSPSRVTREFGVFVGDGLIIGMSKSISGVSKSAKGLASSASDNLNVSSNVNTDYSNHSKKIQDKIINNQVNTSESEIKLSEHIKNIILNVIGEDKVKGLLDDEEVNVKSQQSKLYRGKDSDSLGSNSNNSHVDFSPTININMTDVNDTNVRKATSQLEKEFDKLMKRYVKILEMRNPQGEV